MNAEIFVETDYYFNQILKLIIYGYEQVKKDKQKKPYSRNEIHKIVKEVQKTEDAHCEIEDFLRNDLVNNYLKRSRHNFGLTYFSIQPGSEEISRNVKKGIVDIRFENVSATSLDGTGFIFECKRLNKYSEMLNRYIKKGMMRFISRQYDVTIGGMIAFVEVDTVKHKNGFMPINEIAEQLKSTIDTYKNILNTTQELLPYPLEDQKFEEISDFHNCYWTKHIRNEDYVEINVHHLLLDYYDILIS